MLLVLLAMLGALAGVLTTLAGMGGGLLLIAALTLLGGPHHALAVTSPALFVSNVHRAALFRAEIDRRVALSVGAGALPGALLGGLVLPAVPEVVVTLILLATTIAAVLRAKRLLRLQPRGRSLAAAGAGVGALSSTSGGAGLLLGPVIMSAGLTGASLVATIAACAATMHVGRVVGYAASGLLTSDVVAPVLAVMFGLVAGNLLGRRARAVVRPGREPTIELCALVISTGLAAVGLAR
jgi:uncharacterized membrane protein YfcA